MSYIFLQRPVIDTDIDTIVNAEVQTKTCLGRHHIYKHYITFCEQSNFPFAGCTTATCKTGRLIEFGACKKRRLKHVALSMHNATGSVEFKAKVDRN